MAFPYYFHVMGMRLHPHMVMEGLAYALGLGTHLLIKQRLRALGTVREVERSLWTIAGAVLGALVGAKVLAWAEHWGMLMGTAGAVSPPTAFAPAGTMPSTLEMWLGGKTIVGGLIGGWAGVEIAKRLTGVKERTGDAWVYPLVMSMAVGRIGCFLTGLADQTYGVETNLPWGVDFGDGVRRHPTQLYEVVFLLGLGAMLAGWQKYSRIGFSTGRLFRAFMGAYCVWRFGVEFIKPREELLLRLSAIQIACLCTAVVAIVSLWRGPAASLTKESASE